MIRMSQKKLPGKGQIWHINGDPVSGTEFKGPHYYLVLTQTALTRVLGTAVCLPITSGGGRARSESVAVYLDGSSTKTGKVTGVILCHSLRSFDLEARGAKLVDTVEPHIMREVLDKVIDILDPAD